METWIQLMFGGLVMIIIAFVLFIWAAERSERGPWDEILNAIGLVLLVIGLLLLAGTPAWHLWGLI